MSTRPILLSGGGTGGSLVPLIAVAQELRLRRKDAHLLFCITNAKGDLDLVHEAGFPFRIVPAGKWRRYRDWRNLRDLFVLAYAFFVSLWVVAHVRPQCFITAGSFASVPLAWASALFRVPILVHQQDVRPGLANRLMMPFAQVITVAFEETAHRLRARRSVVWTGNPVRKEILEGEGGRLRSMLGLPLGKPVVLILGGSGGAAALNTLVQASAAELAPTCEILHVVGKHGEGIEPVSPNHHVLRFLGKELPDAYALSELVVTRAGLSTLSELGVREKPAIVLPMPGTHQEENAQYLASHGAAKVLDQRTLTPQKFALEIRQLLTQHEERAQLGRALGRCVRKDGTAQLADRIEALFPVTKFHAP